ncbi:MAG TPA: Ig-like domain-containing protein [Vicinamibacterales bacterium]|nr:Ig-like domain-containing protein [Vicinamibacterales bacterium]
MQVPDCVRRSFVHTLLIALLAWGFVSPGSVSAQTLPSVQFRPAAPYDTGASDPGDAEKADFNNDGVQDVAVLTTLGGSTVHVLVADGNGGLFDPALDAPYGTGIASGDFNGDGVLDLAVTQTANKPGADTTFCNSRTPGTLIFLGAGGGNIGFTLQSCLLGTVSNNLNDAVVADFNGDGKADLAVADNAVGLRVYPGNGDGTFKTPVNAPGASGLRFSRPLVAADLDADGDLDLIAGRNPGVAVFITTVDGQGDPVLTFNAPSGVGSAALQQHLGVLTFGVADVNRDGFLDIAGIERGTLPATPTTTQTFFFASLGTGNGIGYTLGSEAHLIPGTNIGTLDLADFNKDGTRDVVVADPDGNRIRLFLGHGNGTFAVGPVVTVGARPKYAAAIDLNGDNWIDVAAVDAPPGMQSTTWVLEQIPGTGDATPPSVSLTSPAAGSSLQGVVTIAATATDATGVARVDFYRGNQLIGSDTTDPYSYAWNTAMTPNGSYTLSARAYDVADNAATSAGVSVTVANTDTTPPTASVTTPAAGSLLSGTVTLVATASDFNGVTGVDFYYGATLIGSSATPAPGPYSLSWNTVGIPAGVYALTARAHDAAGNTGTSAAVNATVDQVPTANAGPAQTVEATSGAGANVTLAGSGTDPDAGDTLSYRWTVFGVVIATGASPAVMLPPGIHAVVLRVTDSYGAFAEATVNITVQDTTPPTLNLPAPAVAEATSAAGAAVTFIATATDIVDGTFAASCTPASGATFPLGTTTVSCTATDGWGNVSAPGQFTVTVQDTAGPVLTLPAGMAGEATSAGGAIVSFVVSASDLVDGARPVSCTPGAGALFPIGTTVVNCSASDLKGHTSLGSFNVTVGDTTAPGVAFASPLNSARVTGVVQLLASVSDNTSVAQVEFFADLASLGVDGIAPFAVDWDTSLVAHGTALSLRAIATDAYGNTAQATIAVTVDHPDTLAPVVTAPAPIVVAATEASGARANVTTSAASVALAGYLAGGSAVDARDPAPVKLPPQATLGGVPTDVTQSTVLPVGISVVSFRFQDASGNIGSATSSVTVLPPVGGIVEVPGLPVTATDPTNAAQPVTATFSAIVQSGLLTADAIAAPLPAPNGLGFVGQVYDMSTSAIVSGAISVCVQGAGFTTANRLLHFENGAWADVTSDASALQVCGSVLGLSPFAVATPANAAPSADAGASQSVEATSAAGATVTLIGTGSDPDPGDTLSYRWTEGATELGTTPSLTILLSMGSHSLTLTVTDNHGNSASATTTVIVQDTTAPVLTLPAPQTIEASNAAGAAATFAASAQDAIEGNVPVACAPASGSTFPLGTTTVSCSASDSAGNTSTGGFAIVVNDTTPPVLTLPANQTVEAMSGAGTLVTFTASALDAVGGVTSVTCVPASGSTFPLGTTTVSCSATDPAGNAASGSFTIAVQSPTLPVMTSLTPSVASPVPYGTTVTWTASAWGGVGPLQYQFWRYNSTTLLWTMVQDYSSSAAFTWTPGATDVGMTYFHARVRNAGSTKVYESYIDTRGFLITSLNPVTLLSVPPNRALPVQYGNTIVWTANATGGTAPLQYQFWRYSYTTRLWSMVRDYSDLANFTWTPTQAEVGTYALHTRVRSAGSTVSYEHYLDTPSFAITDALAAKIVSVTATPASPAAYGSTITWTAAATGGVAPLQYEFWRYSSSTGRWTMVQGYSASASYSWTPAATDVGMTYMHVRVRSVGSAQPWESFLDTKAFMITSPQPVVVTSLTPSPALPVQQGTTVTWTAAGIGGTASLEYQFWRYSYTTRVWSMVQDYSASATHSWTPGPSDVGIHAMHVRARSAGTAVAFEHYLDTRSFAVTAGLPARVTSLTVSPATPAPYGTPITLTAAASGGTAPLEYQFWSYSNQTRQWTLLQDYGDVNTTDWTAGAADIGTHAFQVNVRSAGSVLPFESYVRSADIVVEP